MKDFSVNTEKADVQKAWHKKLDDQLKLLLLTKNIKLHNGCAETFTGNTFKTQGASFWTRKELCDNFNNCVHKLQTILWLQQIKGAGNQYRFKCGKD